jgi:hypothetical protein
MLIVADVAFLVVHDNVIVVAALQVTVAGAEKDDMEGLLVPVPPPDDPDELPPPELAEVLAVDDVFELPPPPQAAAAMESAAMTVTAKDRLAPRPRRCNMSILICRSRIHT